jgi:hypothetical protein
MHVGIRETGATYHVPAAFSAGWEGIIRHYTSFQFIEMFYFHFIPILKAVDDFEQCAKRTWAVSLTSSKHITGQSEFLSLERVKH